MRINTNIPSLNAQRLLGQTGVALARSIGRLSSGFRITRAADDAAGLGIANSLRSQLRSLRQASRNAEQSTAVLQISEGATQTVSSIVDRMKELAAQAASDNTDDAGRGRILAEWNELLSEIDAIVATTQFQGTVLLDGTFAGSFLVRSSGNYSTSDLVTLSTVDLQTTTLGIDAGSVIFTANGTALEWQLALTALDGAVDMVSQAFGDIGAAQNRIDYATANVRTTIENVAAVESTIRDADMAAEMAEFTRNQILQQSGIAMLAQANIAPQAILQLLQ